MYENSEMMSRTKSTTIATGLAMFSMFFGAGNVVFPLALGQLAQDKTFYAILGLLITAVGVPFLGLIAMTLFDGNYKTFFNRIGEVPGALLSFCIMALIGPFGATPRCIALAYSTVQGYLPDISLATFSVGSCVLIYLLTFRKSRLLDVLGYVLTPFLLLCLLIIIVKGFLTTPNLQSIDHSEMTIFLKGLKEGYQTMDLLGAFFFSSVILTCLKEGIPASEHQNHKKLIKATLKASAIGAFLLAAVYVGFSYVAAFHTGDMGAVNQEELLGAIAHKILGPYAGLVASVAVALACLTTAIALCAVFAEYLHHDATVGKLNYQWSLIITLVIAGIFSTLKFTGLIAILAPILSVCYPALIVLSFLNIAYKLYHVQSIKIPVFLTFVLSLIGYFAG